MRNYDLSEVKAREIKKELDARRKTEIDHWYIIANNWSKCRISKTVQLNAIKYFISAQEVKVGEAWGI
jgi:hypothetical protein